MIQPDPLVIATLDRLLTAQCPAEVISAAEDGEWPATLWQSLEETGLSRAWVPEALGGSGASLADGFAIARLAGRYAVPAPLVETLLAGHLLSVAGLAPPAGPLTVAPVDGNAILHISAAGGFEGRVRRVPFIRSASHVVSTIETADGIGLALFDDSAWRVNESAGAVPGLDADATFSGKPVAIADGSEWHDTMLLMGAAVRAQQIAGALEFLLTQSTEYAKTRIQFGRPIAKFQAVQHNLAVLAGEVAAAGAAADSAMKAIVHHGVDTPSAFVAVASAKIRAGEAAGAGAAIAHQVHGAIGYTREYSLHQRTRRLWTWRDDFYSERVWATRLGKHICQQGADNLWPLLTSI